jgi:hypothetical protein
MELKLNKPICFDLETTGIDGKDRIRNINIQSFSKRKQKKERG